MYSVKAVSELTGITADTLRAWERRYGAVTPLREANGRRSYTTSDIGRLRLLRNASDMGHPIGKLATLPNNKLEALIRDDSNNSAQLRISDLIERLVDEINSYNIDACEEILALATTGLSPLALVREVFGPTLKEIGQLWHSGHLTVAQEHLLSSSIKRHILSLIHTYQKQSSGAKIFFCTLSAEKHEFGILMCALLAAGQRMRCYYFGPDLPGRELIHAASFIKPAVIVLSIVRQPVDQKTIQELYRLSDQIPQETEIWIGGEASTQLNDQNLPTNCHILPSLDEFYQRLNLLDIK